MAGLETPAPVGDVPADVALVRDFVNTTDRETGTDDLDSTAGLTGFLHGHGLLARRGRSSAADLELAHRLRAGLRRALEHNHDGTSGDVAGLDGALGALPIRMQWDGDRTRLVPSGPQVRAGLAAVALAAQSAAETATWDRLKICAADECGWAYYDASRNRSRAWCEYGCGNRVKVRAYRARRRAVADAD